MIDSDFSKVIVLSVGPMDDHQVRLAEILSGSRWALCPDTKWTLESCSSLATALPALRGGRIPIVLCDRDRKPNEWKEMLDRLRSLSSPPFLIVTSRLADDRLWAEALNLGAHDVLAKPFEATEVVRIFSMAWLRWEQRKKVPAALTRARAGAQILAACRLPVAI